MNKTPTYNDFFDVVSQHFKKLNYIKSNRENDEYLKSEEAVQEIRNAYNNNKAQYENGEITRDVFMVGSASSVAYCLYMMY